MDFRSDYWSLYVSRLPDVSLVHGLLLTRRLLDSPEVVESDSEPFFSDLEDVYIREMFCRFALASGGGVRPTRWPFPMAGIRFPYYLTKYHFLLH